MAMRNNSATPGTSRLLGYDWLWLELSIYLFVVSVRYHCFDSMYVRAEAPHLHLLAFARLNSQRVRIHPFTNRNICGLGRVRQYIKYCRLLDDRKIGHHRDDLLQNSSYF